MKRTSMFAALAWAGALAVPGQTQGPAPPGEGPALGFDRITQDDITGGGLTLRQIRRKGLLIFSTPFNKLDGFGDGPLDPFNLDKTSPGNRPTLQNNGTFMRMNGLDSQTCLECHGVLSNNVIPATFGIGGHAGIGGVAMAGPTEVDIDDSEDNGWASYNGRLINPPFVFGAGGVELVAKEMTIELQDLKQDAFDNPNTIVPLVAKGVSFGDISHDGFDFDTSGVEGIDADLVVKPFGRKGNNSSIRKFDTGALPFHHGMQPEELTDDDDNDGIPDIGVDNDPDGDGVVNEILVGELSALHIFSTAMERPRVLGQGAPAAQNGAAIFDSIGCAACHIPKIETDSDTLPIAFPEVETDPTANVFYMIDLSAAPTSFKPNGAGGLKVELFSDLKRHDMGPGLAESTGDPLDAFFITPRLWGVADTSPYMHDGRALTLTDAIELHGGEGETSATMFAGLSASDKEDLLTFLRTLRVPRQPSADILQGSGPFALQHQ